MPTSLFIGGIARRADLHMLSKGCGNFGPWGILDWLLGTAVTEEEEEEETDFQQEKARDVVEQVVSETKMKPAGPKSRRRRRNS